MASPEMRPLHEAVAGRGPERNAADRGLNSLYSWCNAVIDFFYVRNCSLLPRCSVSFHSTTPSDKRAGKRDITVIPGQAYMTGMTLIEVMAALLVLTVGLLVLTSMQITAIRGNALARDIYEATCLARSAMEGLLTADASELGRHLPPLVEKRGGFVVESSAVLREDGLYLNVRVTWHQGKKERKVEIRCIRKPPLEDP